MMMMTIPGVGQAAKRHVALDVEFAPSFVDNKVTSGQIMSCHVKSCQILMIIILQIKTLSLMMITLLITR